jgi:hypothetical protein
MLIHSRGTALPRDLDYVLGALQAPWIFSTPLATAWRQLDGALDDFTNRQLLAA